MGDLADRMKSYEHAHSYHLTPRVPVVVRVDGRAFHSFTRGCDRPFDQRIVSTMVHAAIQVAKDMQGFVIGYVQSDEASFLLTDTQTLESESWFGYDYAKVVSVSASLMTAHFNREYAIANERVTMSIGGFAADHHKRLGVFDSRAFSIPLDDAPNYFLWRMRDWERNSIQMLAQAHFSHRELHGKKTADMHEMLHTKGVNWADLSTQLRNGTVIARDGISWPVSRWVYEEWRTMIATKMPTEVANE